MEAAIRNLPSEKVRYRALLQTILREQAQVKRVIGDDPAAAALDKKAEGLPSLP